ELFGIDLGGSERGLWRFTRHLQVIPRLLHQGADFVPGESCQLEMNRQVVQVAGISWRHCAPPSHVSPRLPELAWRIRAMTTALVRAPFGRPHSTGSTYALALPGTLPSGLRPSRRSRACPTPGRGFRISPSRGRPPRVDG